MRYIHFSRVSKKVQNVENQILVCKKYIESQIQEGDQVFEFSEPDTSSRIPIKDRPVVQEMLKFLKKGDTLVIYKIDRLARKGTELVNTYCDLRDRGIIIYSINEPGLDETLVHAYAMVAMMERTAIQIRTKDGLERKKANMERVGTTWFGYGLGEEISTYKDTKSEGKPYKLVPDRKEQESIRIILEKYREGLSYQQIADYLQQLGHTNRGGELFHKMTVWRIVQRIQKYPALEPSVALSSH